MDDGERVYSQTIAHLQHNPNKYFWSVTSAIVTTDWEDLFFAFFEFSKIWPNMFLKYHFPSGRCVVYRRYLRHWGRSHDVFHPKEKKIVYATILNSMVLPLLIESKCWRLKGLESFEPLMKRPFEIAFPLPEKMLHNMLFSSFSVFGGCALHNRASWHFVDSRF